MQAVCRALRRIDWRHRPTLVRNDYRAAHMRAYGFPLVHWSDSECAGTLFIGCLSVAFQLRPTWRAPRSAANVTGV